VSSETSTISYLGGALPLRHADEPDVFNSVDHETSDRFQLRVGDDVDVSAARAAQLAEEFPGCFEIDGKVAGKRPDPDAAGEPDGDDLRSQLLKHKRPELNAAAQELGVEAPEALPNKPAVVDAIIAAKAE
jgi:hypothetical protein